MEVAAVEIPKALTMMSASQESNGGFDSAEATTSSPSLSLSHKRLKPDEERNSATASQAESSVNDTEAPLSQTIPMPSEFQGTRLARFFCGESFTVEKALKDAREVEMIELQRAPQLEDLPQYHPGVRDATGYVVVELTPRSKTVSDIDPVTTNPSESGAPTGREQSAIGRKKSLMDADNQALFEVMEQRGTRNWELSRDPCRCNKSHCLKRYCSCFGRGRHCSTLCSCSECRNVLENENSEEWYDSTKNLHIYLRNRRIVNGACACKSNKCLKQYCECRARNAFCTIYCECVECCNLDPNAHHPEAHGQASAEESPGLYGQAKAIRDAKLAAATAVRRASSASTAFPPPDSAPSDHIINLFNIYGPAPARQTGAGMRLSEMQPPSPPSRVSALPPAHDQSRSSSLASLLSAPSSSSHAFVPPPSIASIASSDLSPRIAHVTSQHLVQEPNVVSFKEIPTGVAMIAERMEETSREISESRPQLSLSRVGPAYPEESARATLDSSQAPSNVPDVTKEDSKQESEASLVPVVISYIAQVENQPSAD